MADATVTATGSVFCHDGVTGLKPPLVGARVELVDSDCDVSQICDDIFGARARDGTEFKTKFVAVLGFDTWPDLFDKQCYDPCASRKQAPRPLYGSSSRRFGVT